MSGDQVARICRGGSPKVSLVTLTALLATVGLDLSARAFPGGQPIRDAGHVALLARLKVRLSPALRWRLEVPVVAVADLSIAGVGNDKRAWDAVISGDRWSVGVEAETRLGDLQALYRRIALKRRDGSADLVILLVNATAHNRRVLAIEGLGLEAQFPVTTRSALRSLGSGSKPSADAVVVL